ncbi:MAG: hypothetical protein ABIG93_05285 [archaeon]
MADYNFNDRRVKILLENGLNLPDGVNNGDFEKQIVEMLDGESLIYSTRQNHFKERGGQKVFGVNDLVSRISKNISKKNYVAEDVVEPEVTDINPATELADCFRNMFEDYGFTYDSKEIGLFANETVNNLLRMKQYDTNEEYLLDLVQFTIENLDDQETNGDITNKMLKNGVFGLIFGEADKKAGNEFMKEALRLKNQWENLKNQYDNSTTDKADKVPDEEIEEETRRRKNMFANFVLLNSYDDVKGKELDGTNYYVKMIQDSKRRVRTNSGLIGALVGAGLAGLVAVGYNALSDDGLENSPVEYNVSALEPTLELERKGYENIIANSDDSAEIKNAYLGLANTAGSTDELRAALNDYTCEFGPVEDVVGTFFDGEPNAQQKEYLVDLGFVNFSEGWGPDDSSCK